jgi:hypothetical protein
MSAAAIAEDGGDGRASTSNEPGIPVRGPSRRKKARASGAEPGAAEVPAAPEAAAAVATPSL